MIWDLKNVKIKVKKNIVLFFVYYVNLINLKSFQIIAPLTFISIAVSGIITLNNMKLPIFDNLGPIRMTILYDSL